MVWNYPWKFNECDIEILRMGKKFSVYETFLFNFFFIFWLDSESDPRFYYPF